jgi:hypothetical protein
LWARDRQKHRSWCASDNAGEVQRAPSAGGLAFVLGLKAVDLFLPDGLDLPAIDMALANVRTLYANRVRVLPSSRAGSSKTPSPTCSFQTSSKMGFSWAKASGSKADRGRENLAIAFSPLSMSPIARAGN